LLANGTGCALGPLIGSLVSRWLNYVQTFYFFTVYICVLGIGAIVVLPARVNDKPTQSEEIDEEDATITYSELIKHKSTITSLIGCMIGMICLIFMDPTLSVRLTELGMNENNVGVAFAMMGLSFGLGAVFCGWLC
jgi:predicted MFS family arabinose efflux permease